MNYSKRHIFSFYFAVIDREPTVVLSYSFAMFGMAPCHTTDTTSNTADEFAEHGINHSRGLLIQAQSLPILFVLLCGVVLIHGVVGIVLDQSVFQLILSSYAAVVIAVIRPLVIVIEDTLPLVASKLYVPSAAYVICVWAVAIPPARAVTSHTFPADDA